MSEETKSVPLPNLEFKIKNPDGFQTHYSNFFNICHSAGEFVLEFGFVDINEAQAVFRDRGNAIPFEVKTRIVVSSNNIQNCVDLLNSHHLQYLQEQAERIKVTGKPAKENV